MKKISVEKTQLTVAFSENVTVKGHPRLALRPGAFADYASGSGSDTLVFTAPAHPEPLEWAANATATNLDFNGGAILATEAAATVRLATNILP
ncbi:MAG: hypothetical protein EXS32_04035 [Opitutus sp.]|nr:hypothetical protein [Opitutus sp.]